MNKKILEQFELLVDMIKSNLNTAFFFFKNLKKNELFFRSYTNPTN